MSITVNCPYCCTVAQMDEDGCCDHCGRYLDEDDAPEFEDEIKPFEDTCIGCNCNCDGECDHGE
jgi:hypothetical protein